MKKILIVSVFLIFASAFSANAQVVVKVRPASPKVVVVKPHRPGHAHVWVDGHWRWSKKAHKYVWIKGHWVKRKRGHKWMPGHWAKTPGGHKWVPGHWGRM